MSVTLKIGTEVITILADKFPLEIEFNGKKYILRITKNGKMILN